MKVAVVGARVSLDGRLPKQVGREDVARFMVDELSNAYLQQAPALGG